MRPLRSILLTGAVALGALAGAASPAAAAAGCDRVASPQGSDSDPGTLARPFRSAQRLADALSPGETGCLRAGDYSADEGDEFVLRFERGGAAGAPVTIRSYPGERAHVVGIIMVDRGSDFVRIADLDIEGTGVQNTVKVYAANTVIEGNDITNEMRGDSCLMLGSSSAGRATGTVVRRNTFHDCGAKANENHDHSIYAAQVDDARIVNNTFSNSAAYTVQLYPNAQRTVVARNVMDGGADTIRGGIVIGGDDSTASSGNVVQRNVIAYAPTGSVATYWPGPVGTGNVVRSNCSWAAGDDIDEEGLRAVGNITGNPRFRNRASGDYRLAPDSACMSVLGRKAVSAIAAVASRRR
jgi:hypothetical protein